jgi:hypothetical protein
MVARRAPRLALLFAIPAAAAAQPVPARDLWDFPIGTLAEAPALAGAAAAALHNPATPLLAGRPDGRFLLGVTALSASADQGVEGQIVHGTWVRGAGHAITVSVARAAIGGIVRTGSDPSGLGTVAYDSWVASASSARAIGSHLLVGAAARWRTGRADVETGRALAADLGAVLHRLPLLDARLAVSSFLWRPGREIDDRAAVTLAGDARVLGPRDTRGLRVGTSRHWARRGAQESFTFVRGRYEVLELHAGRLATERFGQRNARWRFGMLFHLQRYSAGIAREDGVERLAPSYQFSLTTALP